jgi:hypothetical protein
MRRLIERRGKREGIRKEVEEEEEEGTGRVVAAFSKAAGFSADMLAPSRCTA